MKRWLISHRWLVIFLGTVVLHVIALAFVRFTDTGQGTGELDEESYQVLKLVDIEEYMPEPAGVPEDTTMVYNQPAASERIITTDDLSTPGSCETICAPRTGCSRTLAHSSGVR